MCSRHSKACLSRQPGTICRCLSTVLCCGVYWLPVLQVLDSMLAYQGQGNGPAGSLLQHAAAADAELHSLLAERHTFLASSCGTTSRADIEAAITQHFLQPAGQLVKTAKHQLPQRINGIKAEVGSMMFHDAACVCVAPSAVKSKCL